ncbi:interferon phi 4 [Triplophysa rosa]|uniref:interferon phi 4 n=1 Tax=Triplophysa rosa TaxID=992332 RepID=UPI002545D454|nr:interferon phi 4 [Triplophysa rosa]
MFVRSSLLCLVLSVCTLRSVLGCRWIKHKFQHHHRVSLDLIEKMGEKIIEGHKNKSSINPIPYELINSYRTVEAEKQILFVIQTLMEITGVFEDADSAPWDKSTMEDFSNIIHEQIDGLQLCGAFKTKRNKKLHLYFRRLRQMIELKTEDAGKGWEIIRARVISILKQLEFFSFYTHGSTKS